MPLGTRARAAVGAVLAAVLIGGLTACDAADAGPVPQATAIAAIGHAAAAGQGSRVRAQSGRARVVADAATASVVTLPARSNGALVVFVHGWSQTRTSLLTRASSAPVLQALTGAGYTVLTADAALKAWGAPVSVQDYRSLMESTQRRYGLRDVFLIGESMGGLATMQLAASLPQVRAVAAWYPVCDLRTMTQQRFQASIDGAWHGLSRAAVSPVQVSAKPLMVWASAGDTVVRASTNAAVCVAAARRAGAAVTYVRTTGEHGDRSNFAPGAIVGFFGAHRSPTA